MLGRLEERTTDSRDRGAVRRKLFIATTIAQSDTGCDVDVFNISESGVLLGTSGLLDLDEPISFVLPGIGERRATIVWHAENLYGCRFDEPLDSQTVATCLSLSLPEGPQLAIPRIGEESFGERLKRLRTDSQFSMVELARQVGVTKPTLWKWETNKVRPREAALKRLAAIFGFTPSELMYGPPDHANRISREPTSENVGSDQKLANVIAESREKIARLAGTQVGKVSIDIDWT